MLYIRHSFPLFWFFCVVLFSAASVMFLCVFVFGYSICIVLCLYLVVVFQIKDRMTLVVAYFAVVRRKPERVCSIIPKGLFVL